ncbi:MAG: DUF4012 domain-containing protein [Caldilineaceae bacterium]
MSTTTSSTIKSQKGDLPIQVESSTRAEVNSRRMKPFPKWLQWLLILLLLVVVYKVAMLSYDGWRLYQSLQTLRTLAANPAGLEQVDTLQSAVQQLNQGMAGLERELGFAAPLLHSLRGLPKVGPALADAPELLAAGKELTAILQESTAVVAPALAAKKPLLGEDSVASSLSGAQAQFAVMEEHAIKASNILNKVDLAALHPTLALNIDTIRTVLRALPAFFRLAPTFPTLIGSDAPQTYLVLVQNNHELRATGGFITAVGRVKLDMGDIADMNFEDSYKVYNKANSYPKAPAAQQKYMAIPLLLFRDGNWSPDLPTSAQTLKALYLQDTGVTVNGIVTVDINAVKTLVDAIGPLKIPESDDEITGANIVDFLKKLWERPTDSNGTVEDFMKSDWWAKRKDFVPKLAQAMLARVRSGSFSKLSVISAVFKSLDDRFVQVWLNNPVAAKALAEQGWDGSLMPVPNADYLALIDTNVGYNKVDSVLSRQLEYQLKWPNGKDGAAQATVTITYTHPTSVPEEDQCDPTSRYGNSYDAMAARCYFDYVRLYVPGGSKLVQAEGFKEGTVETLRGEKGTSIFAGYFVMKTGSQHAVRFTYDLPATIQASTYQLVLQKQSGLAALPVKINVGGKPFETNLQEGLLQWSR